MRSKDLQLHHKGVDDAIREIPGSRLSEEKPTPDSGLNDGVSLGSVIFDVKSEGTPSRCEQERMPEVIKRCFSRSKGR